MRRKRTTIGSVGARRPPQIALLAVMTPLLMLLVVSKGNVAQAQGYPNRAITIIVSYPPGGVLDVVGRLIADGLSKRFSQPVIVVNRVGGAGATGIGEVVRAEPDGYTLLMANDGSHAILPFVDRNFRFDPIKDFVPIAMPAQYAHALLINTETPVTTLSEFIAYAKARPDQLTFGTPGYGSLAHVAMELFMQLTGTRMLQVPYKGAAPALTDLMTGVITSNLQSMSGVVAQVGNPSIRMLAVTSPQRVASLPDVPTMVESGLPQMVVMSWLGLFAPAQVSPQIRDTLSEAVVEIVAAPATQAKLRSLGLEPAALGADAFSAFYRNDIARWKTVVSERNIGIQN
jgi:tripartite-type tricarboxylate transporter receptor subunit TctC